MPHKTPSFSHALFEWVDRDPPLSAATYASYRGAINRLAEYAANENIEKVRDLNKSMWHDYLANLNTERNDASGRRRPALKPASQNQARRITAAFLVWAWEQGYIRWRPSMRELSGNPGIDEPVSAEQELAFPAPLAAALSGSSPVDSMESTRGLLALNLSFWACLSPLEMSTLRIPDAERHVGGIAKIFHHATTSENSAILAPMHVQRIWHRYVYLRRRQFGAIHHEGLFSHLQRDEPVSAWALWHAIRQFQLHDLKLPAALPGHALRRTYFARIMQLLSPPCAAVLDHMDVRFHTIRASRVVDDVPINQADAYARLVRQLRAELTHADQAP